MSDPKPTFSQDKPDQAKESKDSKDQAMKATDKPGGQPAASSLAGDKSGGKSADKAEPKQEAKGGEATKAGGKGEVKDEGKPRKGFLSFVGRLRKSSRKTRASTLAAREAALAQYRKEKEAERNRAKGIKTDEAKGPDGSYLRTAADELVKPIRPEDLKEGAVAAPAESTGKAEEKKPGEPGRLSIDKVERQGTRSQRKGLARSVVLVDEQAEERKRKIASAFKISLAVLFFAVGGVLVFLSLRETRLKVAINTTPAFTVEPEVWVVSDFQERVDLIKRDLQRREEPLRAAIASVDRDLSAAKADYAGRAARKKLLVDALNKDKSEIPVILEGTQKSLDKLWREDADNLDAEYDRKKDAFNKEIAARAKQLNLKNYAPSEELDAPEIAVNAFRLALYSAPDGVETAKEREWAENRLKGWRKYEDDWSDRQNKIKLEADALRQTVQPEVDEVKDRVKAKQDEIAAVDQELEEFGKEVELHQSKIKDSKDQLVEVAQPFLQDLLKAPGDYVRAKWQVEKLGLLDVRNLDRDPRFPPGEYTLFVRAKKKGVDYWAKKNFKVEKFKTTRMTLGDEDFFPVKSLLEDQ